MRNSLPQIQRQVGCTATFVTGSAVSRLFFMAGASSWSLLAAPSLPWHGPSANFWQGFFRFLPSSKPSPPYLCLDFYRPSPSCALLKVPYFLPHPPPPH